MLLTLTLWISYQFVCLGIIMTFNAYHADATREAQKDQTTSDIRTSPPFSSPPPSAINQRDHFSPTLKKMKELFDDELPDLDDRLQVISSFQWNGDVIVELLGPKEASACAPIVLSAGHGGLFKPSYIANRTKDSPHCRHRNHQSGLTSFSNVTDLYTIDIGIHIMANMMKVDYGYERKKEPWMVNKNICKERYGIRDGDSEGSNSVHQIPYLVINHLHRSKVDVNREKGAGAQDDPIAQQAWQAYHDFIAKAQTFIRHTYGTVRTETQWGDEIEGVLGLVLDIHGYSGSKDWRIDQASIPNKTAQNNRSSGKKHGGRKIGISNNHSGYIYPPFIHWGYRLPTSVLNLDSLADVDIRNSTMGFASCLPNQDLESVIRGPRSLASIFHANFHSCKSSTIALTSSSKYESSCGAGIPSAEFPNPEAVARDPKWCGTAAQRLDHQSTATPFCRYFSGGYTTIAHEYLDWQRLPRIGQLRMNTVQMELPRCIRFGDVEVVPEDMAAKPLVGRIESAREAKISSVIMSATVENRAKVHSDFAQALSIAIHSFLHNIFGMQLTRHSIAKVTSNDANSKSFAEKVHTPTEMRSYY